MKRSLIALAALATLGTSAFAQSNVTIYGRFNVTVERQQVGNGPNDLKMVNNSSRWGLKGSEDLGGGMKAGFQLESGFNVNNGAATQGSAFWARQSEVNLSSGSYGMIRLGNFTSEAYYATSDYVGMHNHETGTSSDAFYAYLGRNTGKVAYRTPNMNGATFEAAITEAGTSPNRTQDYALNYDAGPLHLGAGYEKNTPTNSDANQFAVRGLYELGSWVFGGYVQRDKDGYGKGLGSRTTLRLSTMYAMGSTEYHLNVGHAGEYSNVVGSNGKSANQYTLGINQNLSKRTKVYGFFTKVNDSGSTYGNFRSLAVGVRHNF
jgi:predicted porin